MSLAMLIERVTRYEIPGLGDRVRSARLQSGKTLTALAAEAGMSHTNWYRIEREEVKTLPEDTLKAVERALGIQLIPPQEEGSTNT